LLTAENISFATASGVEFTTFHRST
jgi:hypothetical protein